MRWYVNTNNICKIGLRVTCKLHIVDHEIHRRSACGVMFMSLVSIVIASCVLGLVSFQNAVRFSGKSVGWKSIAFRPCSRRKLGANKGSHVCPERLYWSALMATEQ